MIHIQPSVFTIFKAIERDRYQEFCDNYFGFIMKGQYLAANNLLSRNAKQFQTWPFDAHLGKLMRMPDLREKDDKIGQMCAQLAEHELSTEFSILCQFAVMVKSGNEEQAQLMVQKYPLLKAQAERQKTLYTLLEENSLIEYMNLIIDYFPKPAAPSIDQSFFLA